MGPHAAAHTRSPRPPELIHDFHKWRTLGWNGNYKHQTEAMKASLRKHGRRDSKLW